MELYHSSFTGSHYGPRPSWLSVLLRQWGRCSRGKVSLSTTGDFQSLFSSCHWDNTPSEPSLLGIHPLPSRAVHRKKAESQPQQLLLTPLTSSDANTEQSGGGKPSFALSKSIVGPCKGRFVCMLLALHACACLCCIPEGSWVPGSRVGSWLLRSFL